MAETPILNGWKEIAGFLRVHEQTAMKLAKESGLPVMKTDGLVLSSRNLLESWIARNANFEKPS